MIPYRFSLKSTLAYLFFRLLGRHLIRWRLERAIRREYKQLIRETAKLFATIENQKSKIKNDLRR